MLKLFAWLMVVSSLALGLDQAVIVDKLNWQKSNSVCGGNFFQGFSIAAAPAIGEHLTADKVSLADDLQVAKGNVSLVWKNGKVDTDLLSIANMKNGDSLLTANGGVKYESDNDLVVAEKGKMNISQNSSDWERVFFRSINIERGFFWGWSRYLKMFDQNHWQLEDAGWSKCSANEPLWHVEAKKIQINELDDEVLINQGWLYLQDVPIFYFPYINLPLSKKRKTGFLMPKFSHQHYSDSVVHFPWYWNIAINQDAKITPFVGQNNGAGVTANWRYLSSLGFSKLGLFYLQDSGFNEFKEDLLSTVIVDPLRQNGVENLQQANKNRWAIALEHAYQDGYNKLNIDFNAASDDDLTRHFPFAFELQEAQYLPRYLELHKSFNNISYDVIWSQWQVMHSLLWQPIVTPFQATPEITSFGFYDLSHKLQVLAHARLAKFTNQQVPGVPVLPVGNRFVFDPGLVFHVAGLKAVIANHYVIQNLKHQTSQTWSVPKIIVDWQKGAWANNLHILFRSMYMWVPYVNQAGMSHFDMDWMPQFYQQLFMDNRFSGNDWQGDESRLSFGVEINSDPFAGVGDWSMALGQAVAFKQHQLCIDANCIADVLARQKLSEMQFTSKYKFTEQSSARVDLAWDWYGSKKLLGQIEGHHKLLNHDLQFGYMHIKMPQDQFFANHMWQTNPDVKNFYIGADSKFTSAVSSKVNMHWDFDRRQFADLTAELNVKACCANFQIGVVRRFNKSLSANRFEYENRVYLKLSLLT
jgi:lipopolysaccharide assembly outer membrane protein LptD (OstA)